MLWTSEVQLLVNKLPYSRDVSSILYEEVIKDGDSSVCGAVARSTLLRTR